VVPRLPARFPLGIDCLQILNAAMLSQLAAQVHHAEDEVGVFGGFVGIFPLIQPGLSYSPTIPDIYDTW